jgi:hypothetical protein
MEKISEIVSEIVKNAHLAAFISFMSHLKLTAPQKKEEAEREFLGDNFPPLSFPH